MLTEFDLHLFREGSHYALADKLGAHPHADGFYFAVWAPNAARVSVVGDWNGFRPGADPLSPLGDSGIFAGTAAASVGANYKYYIESRFVTPSGEPYHVEKADPFAFASEEPPKTASRLTRLEYTWGDHDWRDQEQKRGPQPRAISTYEVHLGSWQRHAEEGHRFLSYRELAPRLIAYIKETGFSHVEFMPVMEHPFYGSWGYQVTGYFCPTARFGPPEDLMFLVDSLHQAGIGVIFDWVPSHFPTDEHGLSFFDGTHLFEHADPRRGFHPDWKSAIFNYGRNEVRSFLISSALFWLKTYHGDGLRVDGVASMLYNDYSRKAGEWLPNEFGGRENLQAVDFLQRLNSAVRTVAPAAITVAEESTAWPKVSRPVGEGGLGFDRKWDMGWMHDTLSFFQRDPIFRRSHLAELTFRQVYAASENFVLPLSHDEVVHGKGALWAKMPGDDWSKYANLRLLLGYMFAQNGQKLLFMGNEFAQEREWSHDHSLDWHLLSEIANPTAAHHHQGVKRWLTDLNFFYRQTPALYDRDDSPSGFEWIDANDHDHTVLSSIRWDASYSQPVVCVFNFTPVVRHGYRVGTPWGGAWHERLNSDAALYGGSGVGNGGGVSAEEQPWQGRSTSFVLALPPLSVLFFMPKRS